MNPTFLSISKAGHGQEVVRRPRTTDAIGLALRGVFDDTKTLPEEMSRILNALDRTTPRH